MPAKPEEAYRLTSDAAVSETMPLAGVDSHEGLTSPQRRMSTSAIFRELEKKNQVTHRGPIGTALHKFWHYPVNPYGSAHTYWDVYILLLVLWSSMFTPFQIAFLPNRTATWTDLLVDLCFYADIILSFWTGYDNGIEIVTDKGLIARRYLRGWFWLDAAATIQWDALMALFTDAIPDTILGLLRLIKVARLLRAARLIKRLTQSWTTHTGFIEAGSFVVYVMITAHILACFFWLFPALVENNIDAAVCRVEGPELDGSESWQEQLNACPVVDATLCTRLGLDVDDYTLMPSQRRKTLGAATYYFGGQRHCDRTFKGDSSGYCASIPTAHDLTCSWRLDYGLEDFPNNTPSSKYVQSLYWSLTTMTTIGYGDRGPNTSEETILCMFCEIIGLSVFALLLTQINNLNQVLGLARQQKDDVKNEIVGFMKYNLDEHLAGTLITDVIHYLNFKADSIAGFFFEDDDPRFAVLSPELVKDTKVSLFVPPLKRVKFFGHSKEDADETVRVKKMFTDTDTDQGGHLDRMEIMGLTERLGIKFSDDQLDTAMREMDPDGGGEVDFDEFEAWWFTKKNGKPRTPTCPELFLSELAAAMRVNAYSPNDVIQGCGNYGFFLNIILTGKVHINERDPSYLNPKHSRHDQPVRLVSQYDREPFFGLVAVLNQHQKMQLTGTDEWYAKAEVFSDIAFIPGSDTTADSPIGKAVGVRTLIHRYWPKVTGQQGGEEILYGVARNLYHAIWNDDIKFEATPDHEEVQNSLPIEKTMIAMEKRIDVELKKMQVDVDGIMVNLGEKLDALLTKQQAATIAQ